GSEAAARTPPHRTTARRRGRRVGSPGNEAARDASVHARLRAPEPGAHGSAAVGRSGVLVRAYRSVAAATMSDAVHGSWSPRSMRRRSILLALLFSPALGCHGSTGSDSSTTESSGVVGGLSGCGAIHAGQGITSGETFSSCNGQFSLAMQTDGNLVLYANP